MHHATCELRGCNLWMLKGHFHPGLTVAGLSMRRLGCHSGHLCMASVLITQLVYPAIVIVGVHLYETICLSANMGRDEDALGPASDSECQISIQCYYNTLGENLGRILDDTDALFSVLYRRTETVHIYRQAVCTVVSMYFRRNGSWKEPLKIYMYEWGPPHLPWLFVEELFSFLFFFFA